ncbi:hypothetical protein DAEQUDRAFT_99921 [Daedalea quercina L-15889]|uniref:Uncharacterized protein n=1 Tax=Daedalea quercina L-15889 TaxID=1314783 RepID=A0A165KWY8_9APHY|nr:hypothetical protein DAEQUDRAFT_99921 [Daedalea quercina L-15889]
MYLCTRNLPSFLVRRLRPSFHSWRYVEPGIAEVQSPYNIKCRTLQTIHSIIDAVESENSPSGLFHSNERKHRRAQYLASEAHNILVTLRDDMDVVDREAYNVLYARLNHVASFSNPSRYLQVAEEFWEFALRIFHTVSYRSITRHCQPNASTLLQPAAPAVPPSPKAASPTYSVTTPLPPYGWYYQSPRAYMIGLVPSWIPALQWYYC